MKVIKTFHVDITEVVVSVHRTLLDESLPLTETRYKVVVNDIYINTFKDFDRLRDWSMSFKHTLPKDVRLIISISKNDEYSTPF